MSRPSSSFTRHRTAAPTLSLSTAATPAKAPRRRSLERVLAALGAVLTAHAARHQRPYLS